KDNRNSIRKEVLHLIKFVKKTVAIPIYIPFWINESILYIVITPMVTMHCNDNAAKISFYEKHHKEKLNYGII
ncbi:hypothetical protein ACPTKZ_14740, partial [Enterococcus faecium]